MKDRTFQICVRTLAVSAVILYYLAVSRLTVLGMALIKDEPYNGWGTSSWRTGEIVNKPTYFDLHTETLTWVLGHVFGIVTSLVLALAVYLVIEVLRWIGIGPQKLPVCKTSQCPCVRCGAEKKRTSEREGLLAAAAVGAVIGAVVSS